MILVVFVFWEIFYNRLCLSSTFDPTDPYVKNCCNLHVFNSSKQSSLLNWYKEKENFPVIGFTSWLTYHVADHVFLTKGSPWQHIILSLYLAYQAVSIYTIKLKG